MWMLLVRADNNDLPFILPTVAWIADKRGVMFECYLECERNGSLFAASGSTVIGGSHHQQFNYLNLVYDVKYIRYGETYVFDSSIERFGLESIASVNTPDDLYRKLLNETEYVAANRKIYGRLRCDGKNFEPYIYPEIYFERLLAYHSDDFVDNMTCASYCEFTSKIAEQYGQYAAGAAFGDPDAVRSMLPLLCREKRIALYGEVNQVPSDKVVYSQYTEMVSSANEKTAILACETGNLTLVGRQTGDGDLFAWSKHGVCIQIMDPNRPAFMSVNKVDHVWKKPQTTIYECEPDDEQLRRYAKENKILASIIIHSGEMAHNEAMLNFIDFVNYSGMKFGIGVHAARYETCPQLWELIQTPRENGGALGYIEPLLHSGGMGILAESNCPPELLQKHIRYALDKIKRISPDNLPVGYYCFCDTDLPTLSTVNRDSFDAIAGCGLEYIISSALPGENQIIWENHGCMALNQTVCDKHTASPFLRIKSADEVAKALHDHVKRPGWMIGALDAPVVAFQPYIWSEGYKLKKLCDFMVKSPDIIPALPHTVARYAKLLREMGYLTP